MQWMTVVFQLTRLQVYMLFVLNADTKFRAKWDAS